MSYQPHHSERIRHTVPIQTLLTDLKRLLPESSIITDAEILKTYECDALSAYRQLPWLVLLPDTVPQIQQIMRLCYQLGVPVVARGAGTGLSGGALPVDNAVLLSLTKLNNILHIDALNRIARVQPGVRNLAVSEAAKPHGLFYAPDPSSQLACSIGGNLAENSGGVHCLKYGLTVHNVQKITLVTMQGDLITVGSSGLDAPGYDLTALLCGSEGMLGITVEAALKLTPLPQDVQLLLAAFDNIELAGQAVADIIAAGIIPAGLEMMDNAAIRAAEDFAHAGYPLNAAAILLCEIDGSTAEVNSDIRILQQLLQQSGATEVRLAADLAEQQRMWAGRKAAFPAVGRISPDYYCMDGTIPRKQLAEMLKYITQLSKEFGLGVANVFHAGDGNLHPLIMYDANQDGQLELAEQFGSKILQRCVDLGGTITGEHGVGVEKINQMCLQFSNAELTQFQRVKSAFDPKRLLNPGKAIPSLNRCAEFGAMHVHASTQPKHSDLPRF